MVTPYFEEENIKLFHGNCLDILNSIPENSVDMIFADPPIFYQMGGYLARLERWFR